MNDKVKRLIAHIKSSNEAAQERLQKFSQDLAANPHHALRWSSDSFEDAAKVHIYSRLLAWWERLDGSGAEEEQEFPTALLMECRSNALSLAREANSYSTSAVANLMEASELKVWADLQTQVEWYTK